MLYTGLWLGLPDIDYYSQGCMALSLEDGTTLLIKGLWSHLST